MTMTTWTKTRTRTRTRTTTWTGLVLVAVALSLGGASCLTVKPVVPDVKTQLENQILGTFQRLDDDLLLSSSVRGAGTPKTLTPHEREVVEALMARAFNKDDLDELKQRQVVGEARTGLLELLAPPEAEAEASRAKRLVEEENRSRTVIMSRVVQLGQGLGDKDLPLVRRIFYRLNVGTALPGDKIQLEDGRWQVVTTVAAPGGR
jgi:hypothetical protein